MSEGEVAAVERLLRSEQMTGWHHYGGAAAACEVGELGLAHAGYTSEGEVGQQPSG